MSRNPFGSVVAIQPRQVWSTAGVGAISSIKRHRRSSGTDSDTSDGASSASERTGMGIRSDADGEEEEADYRHIRSLSSLTLGTPLLQSTTPPLLTPVEATSPTSLIQPSRQKHRKPKRSREQEQQSTATVPGKWEAGLIRSARTILERGQPYLFPSRPGGVGDIHISNEQLAEGAAGSSDAQQTLEPYNPFSMQWEEKGDDEVPEDETFCALCVMAQTEQEEQTNPHLQNLIKHYHKHKLSTKETELCRQISKIYDKTLRPYTDHKQPLPPKMVSLHFHVHAPTPFVLQTRTYNTFNVAIAAMETDMLFKIDPKGATSFEAPQMRMYIQLINERNKLCKSLFQKK